MIDPQDVDGAIRECLYRPEELNTQGTPHGGVPQPTIVQGVVRDFGLHPERLEAQREKVKGWLRQLPDEFHNAAGGGWSFLNLCQTKDGDQWTGEHRVMEAFCVLSIGLGLAEWLPGERTMWEILPGGMPYFITKLTPRVGDASKPAHTSR